ncbi:Pal1-domain-containing protein [Sporormia fimetaria CBS 119925]|uniref:Pal1-domain-containing protein n=1 Tax=Sporormia fimetaria CBS 119925 TaxID=1340428 RepID=A0A6A6V470_9PLEO|nr:Pal1-domain-containing protein [Sporormia fimetaria CBS 119925]
MLADSSVPERRPSPGLTLNLNSNNPFRNRAASPSLNTPPLQTPTSAGSGRPMSRNPFVTAFEAEFNKEASNPQLIDMSASMKESPKKATFGKTAEELFNNLTIEDSNKRPPQHGGPSRSGTMPMNGHRPSRSGEDERRFRPDPRDPRGPPRHRGPPGPRPNPRSPDRNHRPRQRRNSEGSMIDKGSLDPEEERRRRERRKMRDSKDPKARSGKVRRPQGLDIIDKLDVTGIYGPSMIHHDGPYDAVQPHRNRRKDHRAPMQAFPVGSANNAIGGAGPVNKSIDLDTFHGRGAEGFTDFGGSAAEHKRPELQQRSVSFNPKEKADIVHGEETVGLGTSTFLDGAPASRAAIQRRESETFNTAADNGGLGRKKSIAQRIRGISQPRRQAGDGRIMSPEARYGPRTPQPQSAGGSSRVNELNPFDEYDAAYDSKSAAIKNAETEVKEGALSPTSPGARNNHLTRAITADSLDGPPPGETKQSGGGFLSRVKSLKGGRRSRPERPAA